jgi:hypothetical protein
VRDLRAFAQLKMVSVRGYFAGENPDGQKAHAGLLQWVVHVIKPLEGEFPGSRSKVGQHHGRIVAFNKGYRTVFGIKKIDQGRHEGALTTTTFSPHRHDNSFLTIGFVTHFWRCLLER